MFNSFNIIENSANLNTLVEARCYPELLRLLQTFFERSDISKKNKNTIIDFSNTIYPLHLKRSGNYQLTNIDTISFDFAIILKAEGLNLFLNYLIPLACTNKKNETEFKRKFLKTYQNLRKTKKGPETIKRFFNKWGQNLINHRPALQQMFEKGQKTEHHALLRLNTNTKSLIKLSMYLQSVIAEQIENHNKTPRFITVFDPDGTIYKSERIRNILNVYMRICRKYKVGVIYCINNLPRTDFYEAQFFKQIEHVISTSKNKKGNNSTQPVISSKTHAIFQNFAGANEEFLVKELSYFSYEN